MRTLTLFLRVMAVGFFIAGALHLILGAGADVLLGAKLSAAALADPALDSQNRFFGVSFTLYGVLFLLCAADIPKYITVLRCAIWVFFVAGLARVVSILIHGVPPPSILGLLATELLIPPALAWWLSRIKYER